MAPRRGSSGSSSGSNNPVCPYAFVRTEEQASFANDVLFFVALLGITIALCITRKKSAGKALLGWPLIACLFFFLLTYVCSIISTILLACDVGPTMSYYSWSIATVIFSFISNWLFLVVIVFNLNAMLRRQLDVGHSNIVYKIVPLAIVGIMGLLSCALVGLSAYVNHSLSTSDWMYGRNNLYVIALAQARLRIAYWALYLVSVLASGALALMTIFSLRKAGKAGGDLIGWVIALTIAVALSTIFSLVLSSWGLYATLEFSWVATMTLAYLLNFFQILGFIFILCIAKHASWRRQTAAEPPSYQSAYEPVHHSGYNANANYHARQYHEAPEHFDPFKPT